MIKNIAPVDLWIDRAVLHFFTEKKKQDIYFADYFDAGSIGWLNSDLLVETSVTNASEMKCYSIENGLLNASSVVCNEKHINNSINSLGFTSYSQALLFAGKTKSFYQFNENK